MSDFDDLLNLDGPMVNTGTTNANSDPFDLFSSGPTTNENTGGNTGGSLLDFGIDSQISSDNGSSGKVSFEANTNPLYEFTNTDNKMESDSSNLLYDLNSEPTQKEVKSEPSNLLYEYMQNEGQSNGHAENGLTNGTENGVDLLGGGSGDLLGGGSADLLGGGNDLMGGSAEGSGSVDLLGDGDSQNVPVNKTDLLGDPEPVNDNIDLPGNQAAVMDDNTNLLVDSEPVDDKTDLLGNQATVLDDKQDLLGESEPVVVEEVAVQEEPNVTEEPEVTVEPEVTEKPEESMPNDQVQDIVDHEPREAIQTRSRSNSEGSEPDQEKGECVQINGPVSDNRKEDAVDQCSGPVEDDQPKATKDAKDEVVENVDKVLDEGTIETKPEVEETSHSVEDPTVQANTSAGLDKGTIEAEVDNSEVKDDVITEKKDVAINVNESDEIKQEGAELVAETDEQFDDADGMANEVEAETAQVEAETAPVEAETSPVEADAAPVEAETGTTIALVEAKTAPVEAETIPVQAEALNEIEDVKDEPVLEQEEKAVSENVATESPEADIQPKVEEDKTVEAENITPVENAPQEPPKIVQEPELAEQEKKFEDENIAPVENANKKSTEDPEETDQVVEQVKVVEAENVAPAEKPTEEPLQVEVAEQVAEGETFSEQVVSEASQGVREDEAVDEAEAPATLDLGVTYKSTSFVILSPSVDRISSSGSGFTFNKDEDKKKAAVTKETEQVVETKSSKSDENAEKLKVNGASEISENGISEEDAVRDPDVFRESHEKDEIHFAEMNNVRQKFESGKTSSEEQTPKKISVKEEYDQGGEFENEPVKNPDVVREADQPPEEMPEIGMAKNLVSRFKSISEEKSKSVPKARAASPPRKADKVEYESQPDEHLPQYEAKVESGVFESEPKGHEEVVVRSGDVTEDFKPEQGSAKNILNRFKEIETESGKVTQSSPKREMTPDRSGKVEYVSEPRGERIEYTEAKSETGVFENVPQSEEDVVRSGDKADEVLPEAGAAKSMLSKFKQMESEVGNKPPPSPKREISHDKSGKTEFVTEPRGYLEKYEPQTESGEFESTPVIKGEVIRSGEVTEEILPEAGAAKKTMERFKEIQKQSSSPVSSSSRGRAITPPREVSPGRTVAGVVENHPEAREDVIRSGEAVQEPLPEQGSTKNILNKFKEIQTSGSQSSSPGKKTKEFTPPPESGVYENTPSDHLVVETRKSESGVLENTPSKSVADVAREREATPEAEMPEQGYAKNMVSKWKQLESSSGSAKSTSSTSPRFKQFTPPRDRGPLSPKSPMGVTNGVHPSELPGQYQPQESSVIVENNPEVKEGIYREADTDWTAGMPAPNTTSSMLQKFKQIQSKAKEDETSQAPVTKKDESPPPQDIEVNTSLPYMVV